MKRIIGLLIVVFALLPLEVPAQAASDLRLAIRCYENLKWGFQRPDEIALVLTKKDSRDYPDGPFEQIAPDGRFRMGFRNNKMSVSEAEDFWILVKGKVFELKPDLRF